VVWQRVTPPVRDVYEALLEHRKDRLHHRHDDDEGLETKATSRTPRGTRLRLPAHPLRARLRLRSMVREFLDRVFDGSAQPLLVHLVEDRSSRGTARRTGAAGQGVGVMLRRRSLNLASTASVAALEPSVLDCAVIFGLSAAAGADAH